MLQLHMFRLRCAQTYPANIVALLPDPVDGCAQKMLLPYHSAWTSHKLVHLSSTVDCWCLQFAPLAHALYLQPQAKRDFAGAALRTVRKALGSDDKMTAACNSAGLHAKSFLEATPEDGDLPSVQDWLQGQGLSSVPL
eukprot:357733-Pelagomonas_calceolata.AAC.13